MSLKPWMLAAMEDNGYMDTSQGLCNKVANYLEENGSECISTNEFRDACIACNVDPDSITQSDLDQIQRKLN